MHVPESSLEELHERGFAVVEGFLDRDELAAAQKALWHELPHPATFFADPARRERCRRSRFAARKVGPWRSWDLDRLAFHPDLVDLAARFLGSADLRLYQAELRATYVDDARPDDHDIDERTLLAPDRSSANQMTGVLVLFAGAEPGGPPEVAAPRPAGSLLVYRTDLVHRESPSRWPSATRFVLLAGYEAWGTCWTGRARWSNHALGTPWVQMMERATPAERSLFGFPAPHDPFWNEQTVADVSARYPQMDMTPYVASLSWRSSSAR